MSNLPPEEPHRVKLGFPDEGSTPVNIACTQAPPCSDLISDLEGVLEDKERWPNHLCYEALRCQGTEMWAQGCVDAVTQASTVRWMSMYPLPIGRRAVKMEARYLRGPGWENQGLEGIEELLNIVPFEEYERAMWALRVQHRKHAAVHTLSLFGLAEYPTEAHREADRPVAGRLGYVVHGHDRSLIDLLDAAERWWAQFRGLTFRGRPPHTGRWAKPEDFLSAARQVVADIRSEGGKVTQEEVAYRLYTGDRQLREWIEKYRTTWWEVKGP